SVSDTAEYGDYVSGRRVIGDAAREEMKAILKDIQDGKFARGWIDENAAGRPEFGAKRQAETEHSIELVGRQLRSMMSFVDPVTTKPGE
ncbi:MAG: ketol-acid reductoisomerase, partial [Myxococcota bacterium]